MRPWTATGGLSNWTATSSKPITISPTPTKPSVNSILPSRAIGTAQELAPDLTKSFVSLGDIWLQTGKLDDAIVVPTRSDHKRNLVSVHGNLGGALLPKQPNRHGHRPSYQRALALSPESAAAHTALGRCPMEKRGHPTINRLPSTRCWKSTPTISRHIPNLANVLKDAKRLDEAMK